MDCALCLLLGLGRRADATLYRVPVCWAHSGQADVVLTVQAVVQNQAPLILRRENWLDGDGLRPPLAAARQVEESERLSDGAPPEREVELIVEMFRVGMKAGVEDPVRFAAEMLADMEALGAEKRLLDAAFEALGHELQLHQLTTLTTMVEERRPRAE